MSLTILRWNPPHALEGRPAYGSLDGAAEGVLDTPGVTALPVLSGVTEGITGLAPHAEMMAANNETTTARTTLRFSGIGRRHGQCHSE